MNKTYTTCVDDKRYDQIKRAAEKRQCELQPVAMDATMNE